MSKFFQSYSKMMKNEMAGIVGETGMIGDCEEFLDTGSYMLNAIMSADLFKGLPKNKTIAIASDSGIGKSFFCVSIAKEFQKNNPTGYVVYYETENAFTSKMFEERGIDLNRLLYIPIGTVEQFRHESTKFVHEYNDLPKEEQVPFIMILDSVGNLSTEKEYEDAITGANKTDMTKGRLVKSALRTLKMELSRANAPLIMTNHVYSQIGSMYPEDVMTGGKGPLFLSDVVLFLSKRKDKDGTVQVGNFVKARAKKSRFTRENSLVEIYLSFKTGISKYHGLLPFAEKAGVFKRIGNRYEVQDGRKLYEKAIMDSPEEFFTQEVLEKINDVIHAEFSYGEAEETTEDLYLDVSEENEKLKTTELAD
jgi:RecA/RadA recombinase